MLFHAVSDEELLRRHAHALFEDLAEVASIEPDIPGDVFDAHICLVVLLDKGKGAVDIEAMQLGGLGDAMRLCGPQECVEEEVRAPHEI